MREKPLGFSLMNGMPLALVLRDHFRDHRSDLFGMRNIAELHGIAAEPLFQVNRERPKREEI